MRIKISQAVLFLFILFFGINSINAQNWTFPNPTTVAGGCISCVPPGWIVTKGSPDVSTVNNWLGTSNHYDQNGIVQPVPQPDGISDSFLTIAGFEAAQTTFIAPAGADFINIYFGGFGTASAGFGPAGAEPGNTANFVINGTPVPAEAIPWDGQWHMRTYPINPGVSNTILHDATLNDDDNRHATHIFIASTQLGPCSIGIDTDGDGVSDECDLDDDNDGILDSVENSSAAFNVFDSTLDGTFNVTVYDDIPTGVTFNTDGTRMFISGQWNDRIYQYDLSVPFDVTSGVTYGGSASVVTEETNPRDLVFNNDGTKVYIIGAAGDDITQYSLTTAFDVTAGISFDGSESVASQETFPRGLRFNNDGTKVYVIGSISDNINQYAVTTAFDVTSGLTFEGAFSVAAQEPAASSLAFNADGTQLFVTGEDGTDNSIYVYNLNTAFDVTSIGGVTYVGSFSLLGVDASHGLAFTPDGLRFFIADDALENVIQYSVNDVDTDGDSVFNKYDLDSDNDGISDFQESGFANTAYDLNNDGTISIAEAEAVLGAGNADADDDGLMDIFDANIADDSAAASIGTTPAESTDDSDSDSDYLDLDSDGDAIPDAVEAQLTAGYATNFAGDADATDEDADGDGVRDMYDSFNGFGGTFNLPQDSDGDLIFDYLDLDSDNDEAIDFDENGFEVTTAPTYLDPNGSVNDPTLLSDENTGTPEVNYRESSRILDFMRHGKHFLGGKKRHMYFGNSR